MAIFILILLGLALGSFVNALVWRVHEQDALKGKTQKVRGKKLPATSHQPPAKDLSILKGRSMCPHCKHSLKAADLLPVVSWLALKGKCRYCGEPIGWQYPAVELAVSVLYVVSYLVWPQPFDAANLTAFIVWLFAVPALMALLVYDVRWMLLPNRIVFPLTAVAGLGVLVQAVGKQDFSVVIGAAMALVIAGGLFYVLFQVSGGKWIGGGDVKLGFALGLLLLRPELAFLMLFLSSLIGTLVVLPGLLSGKLKRTSRLPFGPFLIVATIIVKLFGAGFIEWYKRQLLL